MICTVFWEREIQTYVSNPDKRHKQNKTCFLDFCVHFHLIFQENGRIYGNGTSGANCVDALLFWLPGAVQLQGHRSEREVTVGPEEPRLLVGLRALTRVVAVAAGRRTDEAQGRYSVLS